MTAYKLVRKTKDGTYYPLFIGKNVPYVPGKLIKAEYIPTSGFAIRTGFHCTLTPHAPHLKMKLKNGEKRVWIKVDISNFNYYDRPESQGGTWVLAQKLKVIRELSPYEVKILNKGGIK